MEEVSTTIAVPPVDHPTNEQPQPDQAILATNESNEHHSLPITTFPQVQEAASGQTKPSTRETQLKNMVDDLVGPEDDDDEQLPPTPPVHQVEPAPFANADSGNYYAARNAPFPKDTSPRGFSQTRTPELRGAPGTWHASNSPTGRSSQRLNSVSNIWGDAFSNSTSPITPNPGATFLPSRMSSNASVHPAKGHSRVNSGTSIRSFLPNQESWSSLEPTPQMIPAGSGRLDRLPSYSGPPLSSSYNGMQSPLLFGAGGGPWSTVPRKSMSNMTPPNGQGG